MTYTQLTDYFGKINAKRDELIKAQMEKDQPLVDCLRKELELLMDMCFLDDEGNALYLSDKIL
jgi:hypothetical protein